MSCWERQRLWLLTSLVIEVMRGARAGTPNPVSSKLARRATTKKDTVQIRHLQMHASTQEL